MQDPIIQKAFEWIARPSGEGFLNDQQHCATRDIFQARLDHLRIELEKQNVDVTSLLIAILGEIGNNAYDHNLGNWRDIPGTYFLADENRKTFVIADRGQGIRKTITHVKPQVKNDREALNVAFTESISGRAPEQRGNGLKFVKSIIESQGWSLECYSGNAVMNISKDQTIADEFSNVISGSIVIIHI